MKIQTLQSLVENLLRYGERPALGLRQEFGVRWWSYRHLYEQTFHVAALLREQQIQPGEHILLWAANCPEWVAVLLGASLRGVIVVPVDADASIRQIQWLMKESRTT